MTLTELSLAQALIRAPSPSYRETPAAEVMLDAFTRLGFDERYRDDAGNVVGVLRRGDGPTVMMNGHLDTVPLGDEALWPHPPLGGEVAEDRLWGRGACDMKSALACMTLAARDVADGDFSGTLMVTGVVQEEVGGLGARHLGETVRADVVILGEPSKLRLMLGHRGRVELLVRFEGRIAHAARQELGDNALYRAVDFLGRLRELTLPAGGPLGASTVTPTVLKTFPEGGHNVVPGRAELILDYRNLPGDEPEAVVRRLQELAPEASITVPAERSASESGKVMCDLPRIAPPYLAPGENAQVTLARAVLQETLPAHGTDFQEGVWWFATDAPHLAKTGAVVIGFGPGEEELAHTTRESVPLAHLKTARAAYAALARAYLKGGSGV
jgi:putative selenium metabolism hydrolase